jgi:hypothetical protein
MYCMCMYTYIVYCVCVCVCVHVNMYIVMCCISRSDASFHNYMSYVYVHVYVCVYIFICVRICMSSCAIISSACVHIQAHTHAPSSDARLPPPFTICMCTNRYIYIYTKLRCNFPDFSQIRLEACLNVLMGYTQFICVYVCTHVCM